MFTVCFNDQIRDRQSETHIENERKSVNAISLWQKMMAINVAWDTISAINYLLQLLAAYKNSHPLINMKEDH